MRRLTVISLLFASQATFAGETEVGHGTFGIKGGFLGLEKGIETDVTTLSYVEQHKNIFSSDWFYKYNITWYSSDTMTKSQEKVNNYLNGFNQLPTIMTTPSIDYEMKGLDVNLALGRDLIHKSENDYLGFGVMVGTSLPWIESGKNSANIDSLSSSEMNGMFDSKTKIMAYKIGPTVAFRKSLNDYFSLYGSGTYAYQSASLSNNYINADLTINGRFQEYDAGVRFQPVEASYSIGWLKLDPRLYATLGYRYSRWDMDSMGLDITGSGTRFNQGTFGMDSKIVYLGLGYSF